MNRGDHVETIQLCTCSKLLHWAHGKVTEVYHASGIRLLGTTSYRVKTPTQTFSCGTPYAGDERYYDVRSVRPLSAVVLLGNLARDLQP